MNHPIPLTLPLDRAADLMVRRGECGNFFLAKARIRNARRKLQAKAAQLAAYRLPYADN